MRGDIGNGLANGESPGEFLRAYLADLDWAGEKRSSLAASGQRDLLARVHAEAATWHGGAPPFLLPNQAARAVDAAIATPAPEGTILYAGTIDPSVNVTATPSEGVGISYGQTFSLHSNPTSTLKIYLDFDGHTTAGTAWNTSQSSFYSSAFSLDSSESFNAEELLRIQSIWQRMAEYFAPFNIDVTTEDPAVAGLSKVDAADTTFGIRVVIKSDGSGTAGSAQLGSFDWNSDTPGFINGTTLSGDPAMIAAAAAHEVGHSLGLGHDGQGTSGYYYGHGSGATAWAPVMGVGYYASVVQWSKGGYAGANNTEDDLAIITSQNSGVALRADDWGNSFTTAGTLAATVSGNVATVSTHGVISGSGTANDVDMFAFQVTAGGGVHLTIGASTEVFVSGRLGATYDALPFTMLDIKATLYDASGKVLFIADDPTTPSASIDVDNLKGGTYYLAIDGTGWGDPLNATAPTGWTEYGSLGQYTISGTYGAGMSSPAPAAYLALDRSGVVTSEMGQSATFTVHAVNATSSLTVQIAGLDGTEGSLSQSSINLNQANNWTAEVTVTGLNDLLLDRDVTSTLTLNTIGATGTSIAVTNLDNDHATFNAGAKAGGTYKKPPTLTNGTLAALAADDGNAMTIGEGTIGSTARLEWRWEVKNLAAGDHAVHLDAVSAGEAFRFEYSADGGTTWQSFAGHAGAATTWNGEFDVTTSSAGSLWVRVVDDVTSGDTRRDSIAVDSLFVETLHEAAAGTTAAAVPHDWVL